MSVRLKEKSRRLMAWTVVALAGVVLLVFGVRLARGPSQTDTPEGGRKPGHQKGTGNIENVEWPDLVIQGIVGSGLSHAVIINHKVLGVNESIDGVKVVSVEAAGAWLEYEGEKRLLKVRKSKGAE